MERGHTLGSASTDWRYPSAEWLERCRFFASVEARWEPWLRDGTVPEAGPECLGMAKWALARGEVKAAMKLLDHLLADDPDSFSSGGVYLDAATASMQLATGEPSATRSAHRERARELLTKHIAAMGELTLANPAAREGLLAHLRSIAADDTFTPVRDDAALKSMPNEEREAWQKVWSALQQAIAAAGG